MEGQSPVKSKSSVCQRQLLTLRVLAIAGDTYSNDVSVGETICNSETSPNKGLDPEAASIAISLFTILLCFLKHTHTR